jgi:hypothetical protein
MKTNTNWAKTKRYSIALAPMSHSTDIIKEFKNLGIKSYIYEIRCSNITVKIGMSDAATTDLGERVYRQVGHLNSWDKPLTGRNGEDFEIINETYKQVYSCEMDHKNITVNIWSFDNYKFLTTTPDVELENAEWELIETHRIIYGKLPIGNLNHRARPRREGPSQDIVNKLFE